ncbi:MAG TPA: hypothetical protein VLH56_18215 [Dissulfurispiraceae bacterium]|nr:hypothetical protein [Dissulfurispiraceae bacterium]
MQLFAETLYPNHPHQENNCIKQGFEHVVVEKMKMSRKGNLDKQKADNPKQIGKVNHHDSGRYIPELMPPWARKKQHDNQPVHPLFQGGALGQNRNEALHLVRVQGRPLKHKLNAQSLQDKNALRQKHFGYLCKKPFYRPCHRKKVQPDRPSQINEMERKQQHQEQ